MKVRNVWMTVLLAGSALGVAGLAQAADVRMFVRHEVTDYAAWRKAYNAFAPIQAKAGVISKSVYQSADDPNDITVVHDFHSLAEAKAFAANPELKSTMEKGGVKGAPQIWYTIRRGK